MRLATISGSVNTSILICIFFCYLERRKIKLLKKAGYHAIRSSHNPASKAILHACNELGMMVLDEYVDIWYPLKEWHAHWYKDREPSISLSLFQFILSQFIG